MFLLTIDQSTISPLDRCLEFNCCRRKTSFLHCSSPGYGSRGKWYRFCSSVKQTSQKDSDAPGTEGLILEKEFRPSFGEYLKALESVKSVRDKKLDENFDGIEQSRGNLSLRKHEKGSKGDRINAKKIKGDKINAMEGQSSDGYVNDSKVEFRNKKREVARRSLDRMSFDAEQLQKKKNGVVLNSDNLKLENRNLNEKLKKVETPAYAIGRSQRNPQMIKGNGALWRRKRDHTEIRNFGCQDEERAAFRSIEDLDGIIGKPQVSKKLMEERIQALAKSLNGADIDIPEWIFSKMMRSARIKFSDYTLLRVIQILGKFGNWKRVLQIIDWLQTRERYTSNRLRYVYTTALDILGKSRRPVEALNVFCAMQQQISTYPDIVAYHSIAVTLGQAGHMKELFDVIDNMRSPPKKKFKAGVLGNWDPRLEPDVVIYNSVLNACVKRKQWEGAFWVWQQLKQHNQQPTAATYGLIMEVMFSCEKYSLVHDFFKRLQKSSIPNALAYKVVVNTLAKEGKIEDAVESVEEMENRGIVGSAALYYDLACGLCSAGRPQEALSQVEKICRVASKPLVVTYTGLLQASAESGHIQDAIFIFNHMKQFCSPNLVTSNIMLKALVDNNFFEEAKTLFSSMTKGANNTSSDIYTFNTMLDACVSEEKWDDFADIYARMLNNGHNFNPKRHLRMILEASRAGKNAAVELTWQKFRKAARTPPPPLIKQRFCSFMERDDHRSAVECVDFEFSGDVKSLSKKAWLTLFQDNSHRFKEDSLLHLLAQGNSIITTKSPNSVLRNLVASCHEFLRTRPHLHLQVGSSSSLLSD